MSVNLIEMGAVSKHPADIAKWIERVIDSCEQPIHESRARQLIVNFENMLLKSNPNNSSDLYYQTFSRNLRFRLDNILYQRIEKNKELND